MEKTRKSQHKHITYAKQATIEKPWFRSKILPLVGNLRA